MPAGMPRWIAHQLVHRYTPLSSTPASRCSASRRPRGSLSRAIAASPPRSAAESSIRAARISSGAACGIVARATMKPDDHISTNRMGAAASRRRLWQRPEEVSRF